MAPILLRIALHAEYRPAGQAKKTSVLSDLAQGGTTYFFLVGFAFLGAT
jgi:hypothetical protein